jgi:hypothetical protein
MLCDMECPNCKKVYEDKIIFNGEKFTCECGTDCVIIPSLKSTFKLKYDNKKDKCSWSAEGYASSQYYNEYDKQAKHNIFTMPAKTKT